MMFIEISFLMVTDVISGMLHYVFAYKVVKLNSRDLCKKGGWVFSES